MASARRTSSRGISGLVTGFHRLQEGPGLAHEGRGLGLEGMDFRLAVVEHGDGNVSGVLWALSFYASPSAHKPDLCVGHPFGAQIAGCERRVG